MIHQKKSEKRHLTTTGKIVAVVFIILFFASGVILYQDKKAEFERDFKSETRRIKDENRIKIDSLFKLDLSNQVILLRKSDSTFNTAMKNGGYRLVNGELIKPNTQTVNGGRANQFNGPISNSQFGDNNNQWISNERVLTDIERKDLIELAIKKLKDKEVNGVVIRRWVNSNSSSFTESLAESLHKSGIKVLRVNIYDPPIRDYKVGIEDIPSWGGRVLVFSIGNFIPL